MAKEDVVSKAVSGINDVLGVAYDEANAEGYAQGKADGIVAGRAQLQAEIDANPVPQPVVHDSGQVIQGFSQEQMDAAVAAKAAELQALVDQKQAEMNQAVLDVQNQLAQKQADLDANQAAADELAKDKSLLDQIKALLP